MWRYAPVKIEQCQIKSLDHPQLNLVVLKKLMILIHAYVQFKCI